MPEATSNSKSGAVTGEADEFLRAIDSLGGRYAAKGTKTIGDADAFLSAIKVAPAEDRLKIYSDYVSGEDCQNRLEQWSHWEASAVFAGLDHLSEAEKPKALVVLSETPAFQYLAKEKPLRIALAFEGAIEQISSSNSAHVLPAQIFDRRDEILRNAFGAEARKTNPLGMEGDGHVLKRLIEVAEELNREGRDVIPDPDAFAHLRAQYS